MIVAGQADANVPIASGAKYFASNIPDARLTVFQDEVAHYIFLDSCTSAGRESLPLLCRDAAGVNRETIHAKTTSLAVEFFTGALN
jgi:predicted dienelactone hydrolase